MAVDKQPEWDWQVRNDYALRTDKEIKLAIKTLRALLLSRRQIRASKKYLEQRAKQGA